LFAQALERYQRDLTSRLLEPLENGAKGFGDLHKFIDAVALQLDQPTAPAGCLMVNTMTEFGGLDLDVIRRSERCIAPFRNGITAAFKRDIAWH